ncbi:MAG: FAD synthase [Candidatus Magasanikbacteria bacterium CG_4_9_14_3_um_filter_32_9]|uniref:FAD synthase n=1 Tax=Candidatus Magasanikbacteria bacterium CG_4_9_14_3_um_filter_32_9 TaxID=1974644 RepID=A0A2M7Z6N0_9BACT|nr:MAG: FAD synthase [Candidatus Magasanikbacteria bacterium CG_4_9_14_3_um_filter_32_9]
MKKIMVFGTFDIFHYGHLQLLKQAKKLGDHLTVVIARDENVIKIKKIKPYHTEKERMEIMESLKMIDSAILGDKKDVYKVIKQEKPDVIALGYDQNVFVDKLENYLKKEKINSIIVRLKPYKEKRLKSRLIKISGNNIQN